MRPRALIKGIMAFSKRKPEKLTSESQLIEDTTKLGGDNESFDEETPDLISSYSSGEEQDTGHELADPGTLARK